MHTSHNKNNKSLKEKQVLQQIIGDIKGINPYQYIKYESAKRKI